ncbi:MAG: hypothetical protein ACOC05_10745, partial [Oceanicaulis sp.]
MLQKLKQALGAHKRKAAAGLLASVAVLGGLAVGAQLAPGYLRERVMPPALGAMQSPRVVSLPAAAGAAPGGYFVLKTRFSEEVGIDCGASGLTLAAARALGTPVEFFAAFAVELTLIDSGRETTLGTYPLLSVRRGAAGSSTCNIAQGISLDEAWRAVGAERHVRARLMTRVESDLDANRLADLAAAFTGAEGRGAVPESFFVANDSGAFSQDVEIRPGPGGSDGAVLCLGPGSGADAPDWAAPCGGAFAIGLVVERKRSRFVDPPSGPQSGP